MVTFTALPDSLSAFRALPQLDLSNPENTCALLLAALNLYVKNKEAGIEAINMLRGPRPMSPFEVQFVRDRLIDKPYLPLSYFSGATVQNSYTPSVPYTLSFLPDPRPQDVEEGYMRLYVRSAGADSPRVITLRRKASGNEWFLWEYSGVFLGIRIPANEDPWA
ncbi:MAG: hypothetical protein E7330_00645 [Clostridiales bacterium]|nr:hypothetical protein [Clostridiales bacterium]